jgi:hypothetical protein
MSAERMSGHYIFVLYCNFVGAALLAYWQAGEAALILEPTEGLPYKKI